MSKTYNPVTKQYVEDGDNANVTNPADPKTGLIAPEENVELVGPPLVGYTDRYARGRDFMRKEVQLGARTRVGVDEFVCESSGNVYDAYWKKVTG